jgi:hypothetical protein
LVLNIKLDEKTDEVYVEQNVFWKIKNEYEHYSKVLVEDEIGIFDEWAAVFIAEHLAFAYMLIANNTAMDKNLRLGLQHKVKGYALQALSAIEQLEQRAPCKENNDTMGLISLLKSYVFRNLYLAMTELGEDGAKEWLRKAMVEREALKNNYGKGTIDTQLYNTFCMEYYLSLVNFLAAREPEEIDEFETLMYKSEIRNYLNSVKKESAENAYLRQIAHWCDN